MQKFRRIMAVVFVVLGAISIWRIAAVDGGRIWYVPVVLFGAAALLWFGPLSRRVEKKG